MKLSQLSKLSLKLSQLSKLSYSSNLHHYQIVAMFFVCCYGNCFIYLFIIMVTITAEGTVQEFS